VLVVNRRAGEAIVMDGGIRVVVLQCDRRSVRLGIQAPEQTGIFREELVVLQASEDSADASRP
jgi:carbon storage regulator